LENYAFRHPFVDYFCISITVVDEFFLQANELAEAGRDTIERRKALSLYSDRRKSEKVDGVNIGMNNW